MRNVNEINLISPYLFVNMFVKVNTLAAVREYFEEELTTILPLNEVKTLFEITCEHFLGWNKLEQKMKLDTRLSESELLDFHFTLKRLKKREPIQYILEEAPFYGLKFKVSPATLIPRPETEELVNLIIKNTDPNATILDIGTGSGCIPITLNKYLPNASVFATDISNDALKIARENANTIEVNVKFIKHDILNEVEIPQIFPEYFDIIVSNPPYVRILEKKEMEKGVVDFEPHLALFVEDDDPLVFYKAIGKFAKKNLDEKGKLYFEINQYLGFETKALLEEMGFKRVKVIKDINNNDRVLYAEK